MLLLKNLTLLWSEKLVESGVQKFCHYLEALLFLFFDVCCSSSAVGSRKARGAYALPLPRFWPRPNFSPPPAPPPNFSAPPPSDFQTVRHPCSSAVGTSQSIVKFQTASNPQNGQNANLQDPRNVWGRGDWSPPYFGRYVKPIIFQSHIKLITTFFLKFQCP